MQCLYMLIHSLPHRDELLHCVRSHGNSKQQERFSRGSGCQAGGGRGLLAEHRRHALRDFGCAEQRSPASIVTAAFVLLSTRVNL